MNSTQIREIVAWIRAHPEHIYESSGETFEDDTPAEVWFRFCRDPTLINEYENPESETMNGTQTTNGCTYVFGRGWCKSLRCNVAPLSGKNRCSFHDHPIFSAEVRDYLSDQHADMNKDFDVSSTLPSILPSTLPSTLPYQATLKVSQAGDGLFQEITRGLALRVEGPNTFRCVGYFLPEKIYSNISDFNKDLPQPYLWGIPKTVPPGAADLSPLTPELKTWCQQQGIICN